ncbi:vesicle-associated membrane protein 3-like [Acanthaster planci]|uniref:Vesicle-associated membrane protein 3-like n=1 Tax=Acanthaster planci TaxID=133434 RepID=A0A8B7Y7I6_ACAPL|nr:vesicle-associated membrane protein 3-like [Acanthaster planci]
MWSRARTYPGADDHTDPSTQAKNKRVEKLQAEVDEVAIILHTSVDKLLERGEKLDDLLDNADDLLAQASSFQTTAKKVKVHYKWRNRLYKVIGVTVVVLIVAVIVVCKYHHRAWGGEAPGSASPPCGYSTEDLGV